MGSVDLTPCDTFHKDRFHIIDMLMVRVYGGSGVASVTQMAQKLTRLFINQPSGWMAEYAVSSYSKVLLTGLLLMACSA